VLFHLADEDVDRVPLEFFERRRGGDDGVNVLAAEHQQNTHDECETSEHGITSFRGCS
jgi:hypothetical protein